MLVKDIEVGGDYYTGGTALGKARVVSKPERKYDHGRIFEVEIEYPDAPGDVRESRRKRKVETRELVRHWTEDDQRVFLKQRERIENKRGWEHELEQHTFDGRVDFGFGGELTVQFSGEVAERVLAKLTGLDFPDEQKAGYGE